MFVLCYFSRSLEFLWVSHTPIYKKSELNVFEPKFFGKISNNWPNDLFGTNVHMTLK